MTDFLGKRWHDMGGETAGEIDRDEHDFAIWEKRVDALVLIAQARGIFTVDALKTLCCNRSLQVSGTKFDLVLRIIQHQHESGGYYLKRAAVAMTLMKMVNQLPRSGSHRNLHHRSRSSVSRRRFRLSLKRNTGYLGLHGSCTRCLSSHERTP